MEMGIMAEAEAVASFVSAADVIPSWRDNVLSGTQPVLFPIGRGELAQVQLGPGLVTLFGGAPGAGKTAFAMQAVVDALRETPTLRACVCNVEMPHEALLDRQLARLSGVELTPIRLRQLGPEHAERIAASFSTLEQVSERLYFVSAPYNLQNVVNTVEACGAELVLLDYIQRIPPAEETGDRRRAVDLTMNHLRGFAVEES